jgi:transmembrane protein EpsG
MTILWINLAIVFIFAWFARYFSYTTLTSIGTMSVKPNKLLALIAIASLVMVSGLRKNIGDTYFYMHAYEFNDFTWDFIKNQKDIGFGVLQMILKIISEDAQILVFTTALITNFLIVIVLYKYSRLFEISLFIYITGGMFIVSMNGIRQVLAASIIFTATKYIIEGNWKKYFCVVLFASTFHLSALVLIPIYFLIRVKAWSKATLMLIFLSIIIVVGFEQFSSILFSAIEDTQYGEYQNFTEGGANIIRVFVYAAPILVSYLGRENLRKIFPNSDYIVNMSIVGLVFMIISTQNWIFARFSLYFNLYQIILISWIIILFREKDQKLVYYGVGLCYLFYFIYENVISLGIDYRSDYLS